MCCGAVNPKHPKDATHGRMRQQVIAGAIAGPLFGRDGQIGHPSLDVMVWVVIGVWLPIVIGLGPTPEDDFENREHLGGIA